MSFLYWKKNFTLLSNKTFRSSLLKKKSLSQHCLFHKIHFHYYSSVLPKKIQNIEKLHSNEIVQNGLNENLNYNNNFNNCSYYNKHSILNNAYPTNTLCNNDSTLMKIYENQNLLKILQTNDSNNDKSGNDNSNDKSDNATPIDSNNDNIKLNEGNKITQEKNKENDPYDMTPTQMIKELNRFVIGQKDAKRAVAVAWRARWRRRQLPEKFKPEVTPKNILMMGPTGCGKTEVARRLARLSKSPFIKVEATKFTEVGYVGKDVSTIIEDLVQNAATIVKAKKKKEMEQKLNTTVNDILLKALTGKLQGQEEKNWKNMLEKGLLEEMTVEIDVARDNDFASFMRSATKNPFLSFSLGSNEQKYEKKQHTIRRARDILIEQELKKTFSDSDLVTQAIELTENDGIVFIDEIDKICGPRDAFRGEHRVSQEGVQRDLLPLIEGSSIQVPNFGKVNTDHILFICAGAFHDTKPSDLMPEFQGRLPVRVELEPLTEDDLYRILSQTEFNLIDQQIEMMKTENVTLTFDDESVREIARVAIECNDRIENIGARRLFTVIEKVMEDLNIEAAEGSMKSFNINKDYVRSHIGKILKAEEIEKFIL